LNIASTKVRIIAIHLVLLIAMQCIHIVGGHAIKANSFYRTDEW
jgi:hypothetical protein